MVMLAAGLVVMMAALWVAWKREEDRDNHA